MTMSQPFPFKHIGSFCLILFFALFRPAAIWPEVPISTAPLAVLAAWVLLLIKIPASVGYSEFLRQHKQLLYLISAYFLLCGASLIANFHRYPDMPAFVRWGLTFPIIQSALVACGFLFSLPQNARGPSITRKQGSYILLLAIATVIPTITFWQFIDNETAYDVYRYTIAGDLGKQGDTLRSIFATSTDFGAISAIVSLCALIFFINNCTKQKWLLASVFFGIFAANFAAGMLSGSRGFLLAAGVGLLTGAYLVLGGRAKFVILSTPSLLLIGLLILQSAPPSVHLKLTAISPAISTLSLGMPVASEDFAINGLSATLGDRADFWSLAIEETRAHPWLGISNGGYRLLNQSLSGSPINNVHNAILQLGVDAGVGGLLLGVLIIYALFKRTVNSTQVPVFAAILVGLLVDNFSDHSLTWIAISTYAILNCSGESPQLSITAQKKIREVLTSPLTSAVLVLILVSQYYEKKSSYGAMTAAEQINLSASYLSYDYKNMPPILISDKLSLALVESGYRGSLNLYPPIAVSDHCAYSYPGSKLLYLPSEQPTINLPSERRLSSKWRFTLATPSDCDHSQEDPSQISRWISNYHRPYGERLRVDNSQILMITNHIAFFSPIFTATSDQVLSLTMNAQDLQGETPTLVISYYESATGAHIVTIRHDADAGTSQVDFDLPSNSRIGGFLKLKLENWREDRKTGARQQILIKNIRLVPK